MPHPQPFAEHRFQYLVERPGHTGQTVVAGQQHRFGRSGQQKSSLPLRDAFGERYHRDFIVGGDYLTAAAEGRTEDNEGYKSLHIGLVLNGVAQEHKVKIKQKTDKSKPRPVIRTPKPQQPHVFDRRTADMEPFDRLGIRELFQLLVHRLRKNPKAWAMLPPKTIASGS